MNAVAGRLLATVSKKSSRTSYLALEDSRPCSNLALPITAFDC